LRLAREGKDLLEIWEARKEIEIALIKLAISRASPEDIAEVSHRLEDMRAAVGMRDINRYLHANKEFHLAIAAGADNLPLRNAAEVLQDYTDKQILNDVNKAYVVDGMDKSLREHEDILDAIRSRDPGAGTKAIQAHFKELEEYFKDKYLGGINR
jgi:DNA-binding GntR family transcriptional regulator